MSCQPYLQWWISPRAHLLLKTEHLVSLPLFLLPALLILPLLPCFLTPSITEPFICLLHSPASCGSAVIFPYITLFFRLSVPFSHLQSWMTHVYDPYKGTHLFSAHAILSFSLLFLSSLLHLSAHVCSQPVFCPFNIHDRWKGHRKLQYPLKLL